MSATTLAGPPAAAIPGSTYGPPLPDQELADLRATLLLGEAELATLRLAHLPAADC